MVIKMSVMISDGVLGLIMFLLLFTIVGTYVINNFCDSEEKRMILGLILVVTSGFFGAICAVIL